MQKIKRNSTKQRRKWLLGLMLLPILFVNACARARCDFPPWPIAGAAVAQELDYLPEKDFPALWEWLARLDKLRDQLN